MFGDFLYQLSPKDLKSLGIQLFNDSVEITSPNTSVNLLSQVPLDRVLILQTMQITANPQTSGDHATECLAIGGTFLGENTLPAPANYYAASQKGIEFNLNGYNSRVYYTFEFDNVIIPARSAIGARVFYSSNTADHYSIVYINGYTIPRGNIAF